MSGKNQALTSILTLNKRLAEAMKKHGLTVQQLAEKAGVAVGTIQKLVTDPHCNPTIGSLEAIGRVLKLSISELLGESDLLGQSIYILEWDDLKAKLNNIPKLIREKSAAAECVKTFTQASNEAFGLRMKDNSMMPIFLENSILIFDPHKQPYNNSFVLVKLKHYAPLVFKQLIIDEPCPYIKSVNPLLKDNLTRLESSDKIIATLIEAKTQY